MLLLLKKLTAAATFGDGGVDLVKQLIGAALGNTFKLYTTAEGAAKTHIDNTISIKAAVLEGLLGMQTLLKAHSPVLDPH